MPDREDRLEDELRELGKNIEYPPTPDISRSVRGRIEAGERRSESIWSRLPSARWAVAAAVAVVMVSPFFSPAFRDAVSNVFVSGGGAGGAGGVSESAGSASSGDAESVPPDDVDLPDSAAPTADEGGEAGSPSSEGRVAGRITVGEAESRVEGLLFLPDFGEPDEIYAVGRSGATLVYDAPGITLTQRPGDIETAFPAAEPGSEDATVNGGRGYWRSAGVLFWERDGVSFRLRAEGFTKDEAVRLAESAR